MFIDSSILMFALILWGVTIYFEYKAEKKKAEQFEQMMQADKEADAVVQDICTQLKEINKALLYINGTISDI